MITKNTYDELGQLISKNVGGQDATGASGLQTVDYNYNISGWLKNINDVNNIGTDLFSFKISYNDFESLGDYDDSANPLYNGNISSTYWKTSSDNILRKYNYSYDVLNRLLEANYLKPTSASTPDNYMEKLSYDKNGNILSLQRNGDRDTDGAQMVNLIDNLEYTYDTNNKNLLVKVDDASSSPQGFKDGANSANEYGYDANGNMTIDNNKGITKIVYNHLNLPTAINFAGTDKISYIYNATGQKIIKIVTENSATTKIHYLAGAFQYKNNALQFFPHPEGYVKKEANNYSYVFNYTDHLGNIRLSYTDIDNNGSIDIDEIVEENEYYPFGLKHESHISSNPYQYKYNGKELQTELGLNMYDYGARNYDPALGRYMNFDFFTEKFENKTPYHYVSNNPTNKVDLGGHYELSVKDQKKYKTLTNYLKNGISEILSNSTIMNGLMKYGGFTEQQIKDKIVKFGKGSIKLEISGDIISNGQYPNPSKDASVYVNKVLAEQIENATTDEERELAILAFLTTTLHETVHYGDNTFRDTPLTRGFGWDFVDAYGYPIKEYEIGFAFEIETFWDNNYSLFDDNRASKQGKEGQDSMKRLVRNKVNNKNIQSLPKNLQEIITRLQSENPDAEIFIIE